MTGLSSEPKKGVLPDSSEAPLVMAPPPGRWQCDVGGGFLHLTGLMKRPNWWVRFWMWFFFNAQWKKQ